MGNVSRGDVTPDKDRAAGGVVLHTDRGVLELDDRLGKAHDIAVQLQQQEGALKQASDRREELVQEALNGP